MRDRPYLLDDGTLVIPGECSDHKYKWWKKEGLPIAEILRELEASREVWARYTGTPYPGDEVEKGAPAKE